MATQTVMTIAQFSQMPPEERVRFELVEGELLPVPSGTPVHSWIRDRLMIRLSAHLDQNPIGIVLSETDCRINEEIVRRPDVSFMTLERWRLGNPDQIPLPFPPDIAVEVLSPSEAAIDVNRKVHEYLNAGSREVWVIDSVNHEIMVRTGSSIRVLESGTDSVLSSTLLPGLAIPVAEVFTTPPV